MEVGISKFFNFLLNLFYNLIFFTIVSYSSQYDVLYIYCIIFCSRFTIYYLRHNIALFEAKLVKLYYLQSLITHNNVFINNVCYIVFVEYYRVIYKYTLITYMF